MSNMPVKNSWFHSAFLEFAIIHPFVIFGASYHILLLKLTISKVVVVVGISKRKLSQKTKGIWRNILPHGDASRVRI
jgi:hypothetical protein